MNKIYIIFIFIIYIIFNIGEAKLNIFDQNLMEITQIRKLSEILIRNTPVNKLKKIAEKKSSGVVLIYTISKEGKDKDNFYNSALQPRIDKKDYKYGVTNGVLVSPEGLVVTTYTATMNSDKYIVAIDSEKNQNDNSYEIKAFPGYEEEEDDEDEEDYSKEDVNSNDNDYYKLINEEINSTDYNNEEQQYNKAVEDPSKQIRELKEQSQYYNKEVQKSMNTINELKKLLDKSKAKNTKDKQLELIKLTQELNEINNKIKSLTLNNNKKKHKSSFYKVKKNNKHNLNIHYNSNTYNAHLVLAISELNLVVLKIDCNKSEKFDYFNVANDAFFQTKHEQDNKLMYNAILIGKCKGEHYVRVSMPYNAKNKFEILKTIVGTVSYKKIKGIPTLILYSPLTWDGAMPENQGGALLSDSGELIGIPYIDWSIHNLSNINNNNNTLLRLKYDCFSTLPFTYAIPASTIKKVLILLSLNMASKLNMHCGLTVTPLSDYYKTLMKNLLKNSTKILNSSILKDLQRIYGLEKFSSISDYIENNQFGVVVEKVTSESPADKAKILVGDVILNLNTEYVTSPETFYNLEVSTIDKSIINLKILRKNKVITMEVKRQ